MCKKVFGIVLAGGHGRRLGGIDKATLQIGGCSTLSRAKRVLSFADAIAVSGREGEGVPCIDDKIKNKGPLAGIAASLAWAEEGGAEWLATVPTDMPFLASALYVKLLNAADGSDLAVASVENRQHWLVAVWSVKLALAAHKALRGDDLSIAHFARTLRTRELIIPHGNQMFLNINTKSDLERAQAQVEAP